MLFDIDTAIFPYYKVYFKHEELDGETIPLTRFPYYKVYFKPFKLLNLEGESLHFHTIKSILNLLYGFPTQLRILYFHTIKSILNRVS